MQAMVPGTEDQFLLIAYGLGWNEVTPDNLLKCRVNKDGSFEVIAGKGSAGKIDDQFALNSSKVIMQIGLSKTSILLPRLV